MRQWLATALFVATAGVAAAQQPVTIAIPSESLTGFCMGIRLARDPSVPGAQDRHPIAFQNVTLPIPQFPVTVNSNDVNMGECSGISTVVNAWNRGARDFFVFSVGSKLPVYQLIATPRITVLSDLRGRSIGIPGIQSAGAEAAEMILRRGARLEPQRDYNFVSVGAGPGGAAALSAGRIDAMPYFPPISFILMDQGLPALADLVTHVPQYVTGVHIVNRRWAEQNRTRFVNFLKNMVTTGDWLANPANEQQVVTWFTQHWAPVGGQLMSRDHAQRTYDFYVKDGRIAFDGYAPEAGVRANIDILIERGYLTRAEVPPLGQVFNFSYLNQALTELGRPTVAEFSR
jgi:hypothetical protein